ncbi:hypothetical protein [Pelagerythrobacter sp.]|uniref:hypothetical protein n=1 Tax=Pelagerythrobacter sp. TaxID=2800702 RepID=UPI0035B336B0
MKRLALLLAFAAGAAQAQTVPAPVAPAPQDGAAIAAKLKTWKGSVARADGRLVCRTRTSTGDRRLDAIRCGAMLTCARDSQDELDALLASAMASGERARAFDRLMAPAKPCMDKYQADAVARLTAERGAS